MFPTSRCRLSGSMNPGTSTPAILAASFRCSSSPRTSVVTSVLPGKSQLLSHGSFKLGIVHCFARGEDEGCIPAYWIAEFVAGLNRLQDRSGNLLRLSLDAAAEAQDGIEGDASLVVDIGAGHRRAVDLAFQHRSHFVLLAAVRARKNPFDDRKGSTQSRKGTSLCSVSVAVRSKRRWLYRLPAHRPAVWRDGWQ